MTAHRLLLVFARAPLMALPFLALVHAGWPPALAGWIPDVLYPAVTARHVAFRGLVQIALGAWCALAVVDPRWRPRWSVATTAVCALVAAATLADVMGVDPPRSLWGSLERMGGLIGLVHLAAFYVLASTVLDQQRHWRALAVTTVAVATAIAVGTIGQATSVRWGVWMPVGLRDMHGADPAVPTLPAEYRADLALGTPLGLALYLTLHAFLAGLLAARANRWARLALLAAASAMLTGVVLTETRIAWAGAAIGGLYVLAVRRGARRGSLWPLATISGAALITCLGLAQLNPDRLASIPGLDRLHSVTAHVGQRITLWQQCLEAVLAHPLGLGQDNFAVVANQRDHAGLGWSSDWFDRPHQAFLGWFAEGGITGGLAFAGLFAVPWWLLRRRTSPRPRAERGLLGGLLLAYAVYLCAQPEDLMGALLFFGLLAYLVATDPRARAAARREVAPSARLWAAAAVLGLAVALLGWLGHTAPVARAAATLWTVAAHTARLRDAGPAPAAAGRSPDLDALAAARAALAVPTGALPEAREAVGDLALAMLQRDDVLAAARDRVVELALGAAQQQVARERAQRVRTLVVAARLHEAAGRLAEARSLLERARERAPDKRIVALTLTMLRLRLGEGDAALDQLQARHRAVPGDRRVREALLIAAVREDRRDVAAATLNAMAERQALPSLIALQALREAGAEELFVAACTQIADHGARLVESDGPPPVGPDLSFAHAVAALYADRAAQADVFLGALVTLAPPSLSRPLPRRLADALRHARRWDWLVRWRADAVAAAERDVDRGRVQASAVRPLYVALAEAHVDAGERRHAKAVLRRAAARDPAFDDEARRRIAAIGH
ncbi:MAG: O-antigen ligase family protein [Planctomycetota bacterium]